MIPVAGQRVGPYEILGRLGSGGMGLVFSAWDSRLQRDVAIKLLREEFIRSDSRERFLMEARAASGLNHPNICTVFDIGEQDGDPYLVMELLKGETLRARITDGPLPPDEVVHIGAEVADALAAAHARGIIHRDIKPANIFLVDKPTGGVQAKVLDFGLAKVDLPDGEDPALHMTGPGSTVGTVAYMSPEQARGEFLDTRSDLFALGIVLYEMATGYVPFGGATSALIFVQLLSHPPEPIHDFTPGVPAGLEHIILKLLEKDRAERFQTAREVLAALHQVELRKAPRSGFFKPPGSWSRTSTSNIPPPDPVPDSRRRSARPSEAGKPTSSNRPPSTGKSSEEVLLIRPVRREPLPPTELSASAAHWVRPPRLSGISASPESSGEQPIASPTPQPPPQIPPASRAALERSPRPIEAEAAPPPTPSAKLPARTPLWLWFALGAVLLGVAGMIYRKAASGSQLPEGPPALLLAAVANHTGDKTLDGVFLESLRLDLAQSPRLILSNTPAAEPASLADAQRIASASNAGIFLFGEVRTALGASTVSIALYNTATGAPILQAEETAASRDQIPDLIDRLSARIRLAVRDSSSFTPLARDATSSLEALQAYAAGLSAASAGRPFDALASLQHAVSLNARFTQAWISLAALYRQQHAELAAADAATHARDAGAAASDRTRLLAEASYELNSTADYPRASAVLDQLAAAYPLDPSIAAQRALLLRLQGHFLDALDLAQDSLTRNPYDSEASRQAILSQLALNRTEAARATEAQSETRGQPHPELQPLLSFPLDRAPISSPTPGDTLAAQIGRAQMLDATGQGAAGTPQWTAAASTARNTPGLSSAASFVLAQAALDRALAFDCRAATALAREASAQPRGQDALFATGMAEGLCGDLNGTRRAVQTLLAQYPQSFPAKSFYLAALTAVDQIGSGNLDGALATLDAAKQYDLLSLTPYLRGFAHSAAHQWPLAVADFQSVLDHPGATAIVNPSAYSMSQLGQTRAYAAAGNTPAAINAYREFLQTWKAAGPVDPLLTEATTHSK